MKEYDEKWMRVAVEQADQALQRGEFPVGCVFVENDHLLASGQRQSTKEHVNEIDHAEMVGLRKLITQKRNNDLNQVTLYCTMEPCLMCYTTLLLSGIRTIIYGYEDVMGGGTSLELSTLAPLYKTITMDIRPGILRRECLDLFYRYFKNPQYNYLNTTLLAEYTLKQGRLEQL